MVYHDGGGNAVSVVNNRIGNLQNLFGARRNAGGTLTLKNGAKHERVAGATTFNASFSINFIGSDATDPQKTLYSYKYNGVPTDREMDDMIDAVNSEFGI